MRRLSLINLGSRLYISEGMRGIAFVAEFSIGWTFQILAGLMLMATVIVGVINLPLPDVQPEVRNMSKIEVITQNFAFVFIFQP